MNELKNKLKEQIIEAVNLEDITPADIQDDAPIFGDGLGLDSIDGLELMLLMERNYGIKLANSTEARPIFKSIETMAEFIAKNRTK